MTEGGVTRVGADDFWAALEEYEEYIATNGQSKTSPPLQIVASAGSVVHVGGSVGSSFGAIGTADSAVLTHSSSWDLRGLATEIRTLREATLANPSDRDNQIHVGALAEAEAAAEVGDANKVAVVLRRIGTWVGDSASDLGLAMLEAAVRKQAGL